MRVIGFGTLYRRDDGVGPAVAAALRARGVDALDILGDGLALAEAVRGESRVVVVDAMRSGRAPGTVLELAAGELDRSRAAFPASTHVYGAVEGIGIARRLGWLPEDVVLVGVEGETFAHGAELSAPVAAAVPGVVARILDGCARASLTKPR